MDTNNLDKLKFLHIGADPEFDSPVVFEHFKVEINTTDNPFSASQWVLANGLPDAVICERNLPGGDGFEFHNFWVEQFDIKKSIPFILLDDEKNQETVAKVLQNEIDDIYTKPTEIETIARRILELKKNKQQNNKDIVSTVPTVNHYETSFLKRTFDIIVASFGLLLYSPVLLIAIIAIRLESKGKVWSVSKKVGTGYMVFDYYMLRSTFTLSERRLKDLVHLKHPKKEVLTDYSDISSNKNQQAGNQASPAFVKLEEDPLITRVGHIIQKSGIDGIPVLINVLKGNMSVVGNKPLPIYEAELLTTNDLTNRINGPVGITGFWRIKSRRRLKKMSHEERRVLENKYSKITKRKFSFWKDTWIILRTIPAVFRKRNV